jgi:predicted transcriptional regulator
MSSGQSAMTTGSRSPRRYVANLAIMSWRYRRVSGHPLLSNSGTGETEAVNGLQLLELGGRQRVGGSDPQAMPDSAVGDMIPHPVDIIIQESLEDMIPPYPCTWNRVLEPILASRVPSIPSRMIESAGARPMNPDSQAVTLAKSQDACLSALNLGTASVTQIAMAARLSVKKIIRALAALESLGLAEKSGKRVTVWRATPRGETCLVIPEDTDQPSEGSLEPSASGRRLLELLDRPIEGRTIAHKLGLSRQGAKHVLRALHRQGRVKFADPHDLSWWVLRADDETPLLTREQERVLSAIPREYATDALKIMRRTQLTADQVEAALQDLVRAGLADAVGEFNKSALFRATANGIEHLQNRSDIDLAKPPHLPVYSDRVRGLLSVIEGGGALRIRDVKDALGWNFQAANSLMQYLKRKSLIQKSDEAFDAPYVLTPMGSLTLAEMTHRGHMTSGYDKNSTNIAPPRWGST